MRSDKMRFIAAGLLAFAILLGGEESRALRSIACLLAGIVIAIIFSAIKDGERDEH